MVTFFYKVIYRGSYPREFTGIEDLPEMKISRAIGPLLNQKKYSKDAKKRLDVYNIDLQDQHLTHPVYATKVRTQAAVPLFFWDLDKKKTLCGLLY